VPDREQLRAIVGEVLADEPVVFSYLFGSRARDQQRGSSDVDIAVSFRPELSASERFDRTLQIGVALERVLQCRVDVVDLAEAPLRLAGRILTERVILTGYDSRERVRYETDLLPQYLDFDYFASKLDAELLSAMAEGRR
jgi:uncharacterized protein